MFYATHINLLMNTFLSESDFTAKEITYVIRISLVYFGWGVEGS